MHPTEANTKMICNYPELLQSFLYVMPAQIDDPIDSDVIKYYFPNHLTIHLNLSNNEVTFICAIESDAAGVIMEYIDLVNQIDELEWQEVIH
jgi:hypothetical protein